MDGEVAADVADAERATSAFNEKAPALVDTEALARLLLRAEAVASSQIERLEVGGRRLMRAKPPTHWERSQRTLLQDRCSATFRRRGLAVRFVSPISLVLATWPKAHIAELSANEIHRRADVSSCDGQYESLGGAVRKCDSPCDQTRISV
jgi:hypothetical protein